ncbi:MAG: type II toxin-antitoxin system VapB family antitoxin [Spirochaetota bacterium]
MREIFGIYGGIVALSIRSPSVEKKARELAIQTGRTMTQVIAEALDSTRKGQDEAQQRLHERLSALAEHCASLPDLDTRSTGLDRP